MTKTVDTPCVVFATPGGLDGGGGIGRMTGYIVDQFATSATAPDTVILDTRGKGSVVFSPFYLGRTLLDLITIVSRRNVQLVHINVSERGSVWRKAIVQLAANLVNKPTVVHLHGATFVDYYESGRFAGQISRWLFRNCTIALVLGESWRVYLRDQVGTDPAKLRVLYNAVPDIGADITCRPPPRADAPLRLLVLANLSERKGISTLLRACHLLAKRGLKFRLTIGGGGDIEGYSRLAKELDVAEQCQFVGWVSREDAHAYVRSHDVLLLPSTHEGLPMVILEALSARLPVITTAVGSIPEVLSHGETASFVPVNQPDALADAIETLARTPDLYTRLSEQGRRLFIERFGIDAYGRSLQQIYRELATGKLPHLLAAPPERVTKPDTSASDETLIKNQGPS